MGDRHTFSAKALHLFPKQRSRHIHWWQCLMKREAERRQINCTHSSSVVQSLVLSRRAVVSADVELTEAGVMLHNVTIEIFPTQKLLQALPGHCCLQWQTKQKKNRSRVFWHTFNIFACTVGCGFLTWTIAAMSMGSIARGNRRMLKSEMEVKAFSAVSTFSELTPTNTAKVAKETCGQGKVWREKKHLQTSSLIWSVSSFCESSSQDSPGLEHSWRWRWRQTSGRQTFSWHSVLAP